MTANQDVTTPPAEVGASQAQEPVWTYRGYRLRPSEFTTAFVHYYRAEIQRSNHWRARLDATTNWAVIAAGAAISFALSSPANHIAVIVLDTFLITLFVWIEARRYRYYELWSYRARLLETDFFAAMLVPPFAPHPEWAEGLAESLLQPDFPISMWEAFGRRLRRNYLWIYFVLGCAWLLKAYLHPVPAASWIELVRRSNLGPVSGEVMLALGLAYNGLLFLIAIMTAPLHQATGEVLPKYPQLPIVAHLLHGLEEHSDVPERGWKRMMPHLSRHRQQLLALVVTDKPRLVAERVINEMKRGVTALQGKGMYTEQEREVLMVALTVTEAAHLKALVRSEDPRAFVVVCPAQEVHGRGFQPLEADTGPGAEMGGLHLRARAKRHNAGPTSP